MPLQLDYGAICLDTSVYESLGLALDSGYLAQLKQFAGSPVVLVQSEMVHFEVESHLSDKIKETKMSLERVLREANRYLGIPRSETDKVKEILISPQTDNEIARDRLYEFYERTGAEIVPSKFADMDKVIKSYFAVTPPFESKKKSEFPDAIALSAVENWAEVNKKKVLVVSQDSGWEAFCKTSDWLDCSKDLKEALALFQPHTKAEQIISELKAELAGDPSSTRFLRSLVRLIESGVDNLQINASAASIYRLDVLSMGATYINHVFNIEQTTLIQASKDLLVISVSVSIECEVVGEYGFMKRYRQTGEDYMIGRTKVYEQHEFDTEVLVSLVGDFSKGFPETIVHKMEFLESKITVEFGELDVFMDEVPFE